MYNHQFYNGKKGWHQVIHGDINESPFINQSFDIVATANTHYYQWNPLNLFRETVRICKNEGIIYIYPNESIITNKGKFSIKEIFEKAG
ncbi:MAG: class I SAM-dependent methyltransferase, partial [Nanoarchaeota archaeon]|nr:class I SAM-dependent methyltransferase [Nanoarchaeota archaeon]